MTPPNPSGTLWSKQVNFNDKLVPGWRSGHPVFFSNALAGEVGEVCNATKHMAGGGTHQVTTTKEQVLEELVDAYIYLVLLAECLGFGEEEFETAFFRKMEVNRKRLASRNLQVPSTLGKG